MDVSEWLTYYEYKYKLWKNRNYKYINNMFYPITLRDKELFGVSKS